MVNASHSTIRVVVIDDHPVFRKGVRALLEGNADIAVVGEAGTGAEAITLAASVHPDVVIMDLMLPDMSGLVATEQIHAQSPETRILVLTSHAESDALVPALKAGAMGYVLKSETRVELVNVIRTITQGQPLVPVEFTSSLVSAIVAKNSALDALTSREMDVLKLIGRGLNNTETALRLNIGEGTVKTHVSSLLNKLHLTDRTQAALYALKHSLVKTDDIEI